MTAREALAEAETRLAAAGVPTPRADAEWLVAHVLGTTRSGAVAAAADVDPSALEPLLRRREAREPLAYVLGEWGFRRLSLRTDARALVPRPETETVVERSLALIRDLEEPRVLDVGVGSGAIALAIADEHPGARVTAIDVAADALEVARENAHVSGIDVDFAEHDVRDGLEGAYDLVVSNPPYVTAEEIETLEPEVRDWEPRIATVGEEHTAAIAAAATAVLVHGGHLVL